MYQLNWSHRLICMCQTIGKRICDCDCDYWVWGVFTHRLLATQMIIKVTQQVAWFVVLSKGKINVNYGSLLGEHLIEV
jgi:hypothetical protein